MKAGMGAGYEFRCSFCGWARAGDSPVMLAPACTSCGCALDAVAVSSCGSAGSGASWVLPPAALLGLRVLGVVVAVLGLFAAARLGWRSAGPSGGLVAFGVGGFLLLPFVPERIS
jgi:hypothetical protein